VEFKKGHKKVILHVTLLEGCSDYSSFLAVVYELPRSLLYSTTVDDEDDKKFYLTSRQMPECSMSQKKRRR